MPSPAPSPVLAAASAAPRRPTLAPLLFDPAAPVSPTSFSLGSAFEHPHSFSLLGARPYTIRSLSDPACGGPSVAWARPRGGEVQVREGAAREGGEQLGGDPLDDEGDSFVALAAFHDPTLFASGDVVELEARGGRAGSRSRERETGAARSPCRSSWTRRMGAKAGARVGTQTESASSSPVASSALAASTFSSTSGPHAGRRRSATISTTSAELLSRSPASDSLARLVSTPPTSPSATSTSPSSPRRARVPSKRRYSLLTSPTLVDTFPRPAVSRPAAKPLPHQPPRSHPSPPSSAFSPSRSYGSLASLSHVLDRDRERHSASSATGGSPGDERRSAASSPSPSSSSTSASPTPRNGSAIDLRALATGSYRALTSALHLSPSTPFAPPVEAPVLAPWASVRALSVRFRPGAPEDGQLNAWVLGLADLEVGGARSWDPRALVAAVGERDEVSARESERGSAAVRARAPWPSVSTSCGSPASVEVRYWDGRTRAVDPSGMDQDQIMRAVLVNPSGA
ncbi:hypothetical protein JCM3775_003312 [Rhodotorula graminis]